MPGTPLTFPYSTIKARSFALDILGNVISGGQTNGGYQQRVNTTGGGLWGLRLEFPTLRTPDQIRAWRVIQYGSDGGVRPVNVAICDLRQAPMPSSFGSDGVPHSDDSSFSDGSMYATPFIVATVAADAAAGATTLRVEFDGDGVPLGGEFFSLSYGGVYRELHVVIEAALVSGNIYDLTIRTPLRAAHVIGEAVNFDHPEGTFVLAESNGMTMPIDMGRRGNGTATFIEYLGAL